MKIMNALAFGLLGVALLSGCGASYRVHHVSTASAARLPSSAVYYALPRTVITVSVPITKISRATPRCNTASYKDKLESLGISTTGASKSPTYQLGEPQLASRVEQDPEHMYAIELDENAVTANKRGFELSERGFLTSSSLESANKAPDLAIKTVEVAAGIVGKLVGLGAPLMPSQDPKAQAPEAQRCEQALTQIHDIRRYRLDLVRGNAQTNGTPKDTLALMLEELNAMEKSLVAEFTGAPTLQQGTITCEIRPKSRAAASSHPEESLTLFELVESRGLRNVSQGCYHTDSFREDTTQPDGKSQVVSVELTAVSTDLAISAEKTQRSPDNPSGLVYRIPAEAIVRYLVEERNPAEKDAVKRRVATRTQLDVAQYGAVAYLPGEAEVDSVSAMYSVKLSPTLGGLVSLSSSTTPLAPETVSAASTSVGAVIDATRADEKGEMEALEQQKKRLELRRDIKKLEEELGSSGSP